ncbi:hypothetical protein MBLNU459_g8372t2 [Dothideomycetes sp. NU459]
MPTTVVNATIYSAAFKSANKRDPPIEAPSLTPISVFLDYHQQSPSLVYDHDERPRKRLRMDFDQGDDLTSTSSDSYITIARTTINLQSPKQELSKHDVDAESKNKVGEVDVGLVKVETLEDGRARLLLVGSGLNDKTSLAVETCEAFQKHELDEINRIAYLERRRKGNTKGGVVRSKCCLYQQNGPEGLSFILECAISWLDGESAFGPRAVASMDWRVLTHYFPESALQAQSPWTPQEFYDSVYHPPADLHLPDCLHKDVLETELYPFQRRAVAWMLQRESPRKVSPTDMKRSFKNVRTIDNQACLVSHLQGVVSSSEHLSAVSEPLGGLLAEEMGLGKTCELIALMCLNRRVLSPNIEEALSAENGAELLIPSSATLIVTPQTILQQWKDELNKHAPGLSVYHYTGISSVTRSTKDQQLLLNELATADVVLMTYGVLGKEVHYALDPPDRSLRRRAKTYTRARSPLVRMHWWRVCLDEAQMVESGVSAAATVASLLPRKHAWAVSGTPLRKNVQDLFGLLIFLRYRPFCDSTTIWNRLVESYRDDFKELFGRIALRHTKDMIRGELRLPPQRRVTLTMPFTTVEEQNYKTLFEEMCEDCGCAVDGAPLQDDWDPNAPVVVERMRTWLVRLRQTCLHPQVGTRNRRALGRGIGPLRTVAEVLEVMIDQNETAVRTESRLAITAQLLRGHIIGNAGDDDRRAEKALEIYQAALQQSEEIVSECRVDLRKAGGSDELAQFDEESENEEKTPEQASRGRYRAALHSALQIQHACAFFTGTAYFQTKSNELLTLPDSDRYKELEDLEALNYDTAKTIRKELLRENSLKAEKLMRIISTRQDQDALKIPSGLSLLESPGGIENMKISEKARHLAKILSVQAELIIEWRAKVVELLLKPLVDKDEGIETTGDEYEDSTKQQDTLYAYIDALRAMIADRSTCLTGQDAPLIDHEMKVLVREAREGNGHDPETILQLLAQRDRLKQKPESLISIRGLIHEARSLETALQWQEGSGRAASETFLVKKQMKDLQSISSAELKIVAELEKSLDLFRSTMNQRLEFYRQLQVISDTVAPYKEELDEALDQRALDVATRKQESQAKSLATLKTKHRFLLHLREEQSSSEETQRICVICQYFHQITYKPQELRVQEEGRSESLSPDRPGSSTDTPHSSSIYTDIGGETLAQIKSIDLRGSFGTKIDTLSRHIIWIREHDPGAKAIVFSQFREFLDVLGTAFKQFGVGFSRMGSKGAVDRFRHDASVECFLLDAKTDSSGLNLVNAQYVFLAEPLINTAIELQAIARVHRIGQQRPTTVVTYLISGTVEEAIYDISVTRRLAHMQDGRSGSSSSQKRAKSRSVTPSLGEAAIDAANSLEMQQAPISKLLVQGKGGGEMVPADDLWSCLFNKSTRRANVSSELQAEVGRHLRVEAAEKRLSAALS